MTELKPCPFCGGKAKRKTGKYNDLGAYGDSKQDKRWYGVFCTSCLISQPKRYYFSRDKADEAWNRRTHENI